MRYFSRLAKDAIISPNELKEVAYPSISPIVLEFLGFRLGTTISQPGSIWLLPLPFTLLICPFI